MDKTIKDYLEPCYKYEGASLYDQISKIKEEVKEVREAVANYSLSESKEDQEALAMEVTDVMVCCTTLLHQIGLDAVARQKVYKAVWEKNNKRGYYDSAAKKQLKENSEPAPWGNIYV